MSLLELEMYLRSVYVIVVFCLKRMLVHVYCISHNLRSFVYNFLKLKIFQIIHAGPLVFGIYLKLCSYIQFVRDLILQPDCCLHMSRNGFTNA